MECVFDSIGHCIKAAITGNPSYFCGLLLQMCNGMRVDSCAPWKYFYSVKTGFFLCLNRLQRRCVSRSMQAAFGGMHSLQRKPGLVEAIDVSQCVMHWKPILICLHTSPHSYWKSL